MVFLASFSAISFSCVDSIIMNSMLHSVIASRASLAMPISFGRISLIIFCTVALGKDKSSELEPEYSDIILWQ
ncbi:Uncharacterised protein [Chlamydia trachomatis]|nr:Uncharacterised protein [Chlamydia trachomatis]